MFLWRTRLGDRSKNEIISLSCEFFESDDEKDARAYLPAGAIAYNDEFPSNFGHLLDENGEMKTAFECTGGDEGTQVVWCCACDNSEGWLLIGFSKQPCTLSWSVRENICCACLRTARKY
jgi:hypothetical protein